MPNVTGTTRAQTLFLRQLAQNPTGLPSDTMPHPHLLRRWLRRPAFRQALEELRDTLRFQADLQLASAAANAARLLQTLTEPASSPDLDPGHASALRAQLHALSQLLKLSHLRQRFAPEQTPQPVRTGNLRAYLRKTYPNDSLRGAVELHHSIHPRPHTPPDVKR